MLASQLRADLNDQQTEMLAMVQNIVIQGLTPTQETPVEEHHAQQAANATIKGNVQLQMLQILQAMQVAHANGNGNQYNGSGNQNGGGRPPRANKRTPDNAAFTRLDKSKYCHTHGACNHASSECNRKAPGHRNTATLTNRMGGSNAFCQPVVAAAEA